MPTYFTDPIDVEFNIDVSNLCNKLHKQSR